MGGRIIGDGGKIIEEKGDLKTIPVRHERGENNDFHGQHSIPRPDLGSVWTTIGGKIHDEEVLGRDFKIDQGCVA